LRPQDLEQIAILFDQIRAALHWRKHQSSDKQMASEFELHLKETLNELSKHLSKENLGLGLKTELILDAKFWLMGICWDKIFEFLELNATEIGDSYT